MLKRVIVTFREAGWHKWKDAPLKVTYLKSDHRHLFHWRVEVGVVDSDREIEFHTLLEDASHLVREMEARTGWVQSGDPLFWSCEQRAEWLMANLREIKYDPLAVECWEDGECGARVEV